jgi:dTDP-4-dehydrorhamnose 3,5-epimerase
MIFHPLPIEGAFRIDLDLREDARGFFARLYCEQEFAAQGINLRWVQCNTSFTKNAGSLRGLHFQRSPMAETKLIRCLQGGVFDVVVDLRPQSPTFGRWHSVELTAENRTMMLIPQGCAHGFQTLGADTELLYFHSEFYSPQHEGGVRFDDPQLNITWPRAVADVSARDAALPLLSELEIL